MEEASEVQALEEEVEKMEAQVKRMRSEGPARYRSLLELHLRKMRPPATSIDQDPALPPNDHSPPNSNGEITTMQIKLAEALDSLPVLLERINNCTSELEQRISKLQRKKSCNLVFGPDEFAPSQEDDLLNSLLNAA